MNDLDPTKLPPASQYPVGGPIVPLWHDYIDLPESDDHHEHPNLLDDFENDDHPPLTRKQQWYRTFILLGISAIFLLGLARVLGLI